MAKVTQQGYVGQALPRPEDARFIQGAATYIDDVVLPGMVFAAFVRSPHAHARVRSIDGKAAAEDPAFLAMLTGEEAVALSGAMPVYSYEPAQKIEKPAYPCLASGRVRFSNEPVAVVAATDRYTADDVAELVEVDYEPLPVIMDPEVAMRPSSPKLHDNLDSNVGLHLVRSGGDIKAAFAQADGVLRRRFRMHRHTGAPIEPRGIVASYNAGQKTLTVHASTQIPHILKTHLAEILRFPEFAIRVIAPDIGGGFGNKLQVAPEYVAVCLLSMKLGRPVKWIETRRESLSAFIHARDQILDAEIAYKKDGTLLAISCNILVDAGGYMDARISGPTLGAGLWLTGPYKLQAFHCDMKVVMTNKCSYAAYRGFGSTKGVFVIERGVDLIAKELGLDRAEVRRKNLIRPEELPYKTMSGLVYDSGYYEEALDRALAAVDYEGWKAKQAQLRKEGRHIGIGLAMAVEGAGWNTYTAAMARPYVPTQDYSTVTMRMDVSGRVTIYIGDTNCGTSHAVTASQVAADALGARIEDIEVVEGDTAVTPYDSGTRAARFAGVVIPGVAKTAASLRAKVARVAAFMLEAAPEDIEVRASEVFVRGMPSKKITLQRVAQVAFAEVWSLPPDIPPGMEATESYRAPRDSICVTWPYSVHMPIVEV
ncbi:MAG TPA: xanthine dehydrogenase family protein molybdopterin-binding subunit, partial [Burkholderiales bacterium]|nr:xanthine dehydrogenase family protein molybdopterin-binding subunit [Burkholderiales bacterium]